MPADLHIALLVVDEAHFIKNPQALRTQAVRRVIGRADRVMFMTGTPMENRVDEFRNLVSYLQPAIAARMHGIQGARDFRRSVAPVYLRRNQADVLRELPEKIEVDDWVTPSARDEVMYRDAVSSRNFMAMRQAAFASGSESAKLGRVLEIVDESASNGRKVLIFSFFLGVLKTIGDSMPDLLAGTLTGAVAPGQRQKLIDDFTAFEGPAVLVSQIEAGGVGLNIRAASVVIIAEPQWKPSTEVQAIARAHRMGQPDKVLVHRLLAKDQVDERITEILERKTRLFDAYARPSDAKDADARAVDETFHPVNPPSAIVAQIIDAEQHRLGLTGS